MAAVLAVAVTGIGAPRADGAATRPPDPGQIRLLANCFDGCTVTVLLGGNGSGTFASTNSSQVPNGLINCVWLNGQQAPGSDCTETYCCVDRVSPVTFYFTMTPGAGSKSCYGPIGCIAGTISSSHQLASQSTPVQKTFNASFNLIPYGVVVTPGGTGYGFVSSSPAGILCPQGCSSNFDYGTNLTLTASANEDSYFDHWTGACAGQGAACSLTVTGPVTTTFFLTLGSPPTASPAAPTPTPVVTPRVTSKPAGTSTPGKTAAATAAPVASTASDPNGTAEPQSVEPATSPSAPTTEAPGGPTQQVATTPPVAPVATGSDLTPIALAILGAGLFIAIGIGAAAYALRRRSAT